MIKKNKGSAVLARNNWLFDEKGGHISIICAPLDMKVLMLFSV